MQGPYLHMSSLALGSDMSQWKWTLCYFHVYKGIFERTKLIEKLWWYMYAYINIKNGGKNTRIVETNCNLKCLSLNLTILVERIMFSANTFFPDILSYCNCAASWDFTWYRCIMHEGFNVAIVFLKYCRKILNTCIYSFVWSSLVHNRLWPGEAIW